MSSLRMLAVLFAAAAGGSATKAGGAEIRAAGGERFRYRALGRVCVKGKAEPVEVSELSGEIMLP